MAYQNADAIQRVEMAPNFKFDRDIRMT
jgi:hypothetical protein